MSFSPNPNQRRRVSRNFENSPSLTEQAHKDEVDIHSIMRKYQKTGIIEHLNKFEGTYNDYADAPDFQEAQNIIANATSLFASLPSSIRREMDNDPQKFVDFMQNPENHEEIEALGLSASHLPERKAKEVPTPTPKPKAPKEPPTDSQDED